MAEVINSGRTYIATKIGSGEVVDFDRFIFAHIPGLDHNLPVDMDEPMPAPADIVHVQAVTRSAYTSNDEVVYSVLLDTDTGDFEFNWIGLQASDDTLCAVSYVPVTQKIKTVGAVLGNSITRNFLIAFVDAKQHTNITIDATAVGGGDVFRTADNVLSGNNTFTKDVKIDGINAAEAIKKNQFQTALMATRHWEESSSGITNLIDLAWSSKLKKYCAVGDVGKGTETRVVTSVDGKSWVKQTTPDANYYSIDWSETLELFVAIGPSVAMTSPDGEIWTAQTVPAFPWQKVKWVQDLALWVAVGSNGLMTSPDGETWTLQTVPAKNWLAIDWSPKLALLCVVGSNGLMTSPDGENWTLQTVPAKNWITVKWSPTLEVFCAIESASSGTSSMVIHSDDGETWQESSVPMHSWRHLEWSEALGIFCLAGNYQNGIAVSQSLDSWTHIQALSFAVGGLVWNPDHNVFCAVGGASTGGAAISW